jgi:hypothetical protein
MGFMLQESTMNHDLSLGARPLAKGQIRCIPAALGRRVKCLSGSLWITQDGDGRDIVLAPGEGFEFDRPGDALVSALADSSYLLPRARAPARARSAIGPGPSAHRGAAAP